MQVYANSNRVALKTLFFFIAVLFIAFLPVSTFLFSLKNDAFTGYLPPKFFMSESIHASHLPLWNPYINYGIPQYGDMSSGYWSPITWFIAATLGYNAYTLTLELLFYILLGGIGMYKLAGAWKLDYYIRIIAAVSFMCCGYNVGHLQHFNWVSGAAFLPWCFWCYLLLLKNFSFRNTIVAVLLFYMLAASAHPGITISAFYFFFGVFVFCFFKSNTSVPVWNRIKQVSLSHGTFLLLFVLISAGMIAGYLDIMPFFLRGHKVALVDSLSNPTSLQSWTSALLPFATVKNHSFYNTDISMRNSYFSLALLLFLIHACLNKKTNWQKFLLVAGMLFALLSSGGIFKSLAHTFIPFIGYIRLNGEFRIFSLLCFIIIATIELDKFFQQKKTFQGKIKLIYYVVEIIVIACIAYGLYKAIGNKQSFLFSTHSFETKNSIGLKLKAFINTITFYDTIWIQSFIQLLILWSIKWCLKCSNLKLLKNILVADMVIASLLNLPFTGVGIASVAQVQAVLNKSPTGIPIPTLQPINSIDSIAPEEKALIGDWSMYNKQIGVKDEVAYPIILKNMRAYFEHRKFSQENIFLKEPFIFVEDARGRNQIEIKSFEPNRIMANVTADSSTNLVLQQNYYPHWFYQNGEVKKAVDPFGINFMKAPVIAGQNNIIFSFEPSGVKGAMLLSFILFVVYGLILFISFFKPSFLSSPKK
ncbi:MAG: hypothetical protein ABIN01_24330 [Ferruginibacter sp.]